MSMPTITEFDDLPSEGGTLSYGRRMTQFAGPRRPVVCQFDRDGLTNDLRSKYSIILASNKVGAVSCFGHGLGTAAYHDWPRRIPPCNEAELEDA
jgi:hypothetical protein